MYKLPFGHGDWIRKESFLFSKACKGFIGADSEDLKVRCLPPIWFQFR